MTLNQFAKRLAEIHNESGLLYCDMIRDQDTLFFVQESICDLLIQANQNGSVSDKTLLQFDHVFSLSPHKNK